MDGLGQRGILSQQDADLFGQAIIQAQHFDQKIGLFLHLQLARLADLVQIFAVQGVGVAMRLVAVGLPGLRQQDQRRRIGGLQRKGEIEQDEGIEVETHPAREIGDHPQQDQDRLGDQKHRRAEKPREALGLEGEPVIAESRAEMGVRQMKPPMIFGGLFGSWQGIGHGLLHGAKFGAAGHARSKLCDA